MNFPHGKCPVVRLTPALLLICFFTAAGASGQETAATSANKPVPATQNQSAADEDFELKITEERITETNFARSTNVELSGVRRGGGGSSSGGEFRLEVGVGVRAKSIDVILRGIIGRVRFRGSLESLRRRLEQTKAAAERLPPGQKPPPLPQ